MGPAPRLTYFKWDEVRIGRIRDVSGLSAEATTDEAHIKAALGFDVAKARKDVRPVLVYFHWPHEHAQHGKATTTVCTRTLDDEQAARWSKMFRTVQVDMSETELKYAKQIGYTDGPTMVAIDNDLKVVGEIPVMKSGAKLKKALEGAFKKFPGAVKRLKAAESSQKRAIAKAKKLEKKDEFDEAVKLIDDIRFGNVRVTKCWEKAYSYGMLLSQKAERARQK